MIGDALATLQQHGASLSVAESLTGGLLANAIVEVPGASSVFRGGIVAYSNDIKHRVLGVSNSLLEEFGPVDPQVATAMANGVVRVCRTDVGVATTGEAGPDSSTGLAPGTVFIAMVVEKLGVSIVRGYQFTGSREEIRQASVAAAVELLSEGIRGY